MDLQNMKHFLQMTDNNDMNDMSEEDNEDLEDELNAIISGKIYTTKGKQSNISSAVNTKRNQQVVTKDNKIKKTSKFNDNSNFMLSNDLLNFDNLEVIGNLNEDIDDCDEDIDENDEQFLSEIKSIVSDESVVNRDNSKNESKPLPSTQQNSSQIDLQFIKQMDTKNILPVMTKSKIETTMGSSEPMPKRQQMITSEVNSQSVNSNETNSINQTTRLITLRDDYKKAALSAKKCGQQSVALAHIKTAKQIEILIKALEDGKSVDLSALPESPTIVMPSTSQNSEKVITENQTPSQTIESNDNNESVDQIDIENVEITEEDAKKYFNAPPPPNTVMEALDQRMTKFKSTLEVANQENNSSKSRRLGRIIKQYENAIKDYKRGKPVDFDELPTPPGFGSIPVPNSGPQKTEFSSVKQTSEVIAESNLNKLPISANKPLIDRRQQPPPPQQSQQSQQQQTTTKDSTPPKSTQKPLLKRATSTANKQLNYLLERQRLFKEAALESKQKGNIQQAKEYLRMAKGFDPLIEATQNGLPIDATSIPTPPQMTDDFVIVSHTESSDVNDLEREEMFRKIEVEMQNQIEMCKRNREYFLHLGDISTASKFEKYATDSCKDLDVLLNRWRNGHKVPDIKYETRTFSIVICNTEVAINEVSLEVLKAIDIVGKPDIDTYIKIEFPFPSDKNQTTRTKTVKNSVNPVFNETFKFQIDRKSRQLPRIFKRHPLKLEIISKGGFLRSDTLIGTAVIKLTDLESKCTIHETFTLTEGRKPVGGRIEAKVKIREPLLAKQVEEVKEKWLVFV
ncbi:coiled-coil and C2 domain-containing protein 1-like [Oppia nitens]|uniref:coiled-coil and C2 domain-containing protein 1-like n=1 Tax=Oppia nitens TaxID=1686743 RepID=UPI0023DB501E|nr:coiled-coil and C2 domain-containing protein 1-like [Oppia nitens]